MKNIAFNCTFGQKDLRHGADPEIGRRIILMVPPDPARVIGEGGISKWERKSSSISTPVNHCFTPWHLCRCAAPRGICVGYRAMALAA